MISQDRLQKALTFIAETDELESQLKMETLKMEHAWKATKDAVFLTAEGSVADRTAVANTHEKSQEALSRYLTSVQEHRELDNKRKREFLVVEVWRSQEASRRVGNI